MIHECSWPSHFKRLIKINTHGISIGATMDDVFLKTILRPLIMDHYLEKDWSDWNVLDPAFGWLTRVSAFCPHPFLWFKKSLRVRVYVRDPVHDSKFSTSTESWKLKEKFSKSKCFFVIICVRFWFLWLPTTK